MQDKRTRAVDSRRRPVPGLYVRGGHLVPAGWKRDGRWFMRTLEADHADRCPARAGRTRVAGLRDGRIAGPSTGMTFADVFAGSSRTARSLAERTRRHEQHLRNRHLTALSSRRIQDITANDVAKVLHGMRDSPYSAVDGRRGLSDHGGHVRDGRAGAGVIQAKNPMDGLAPLRTSEAAQREEGSPCSIPTRPWGRARERRRRADRWKAAVGLAGYAGLRLGEVRGLQWVDVELRREPDPRSSLAAPRRDIEGDEDGSRERGPLPCSALVGCS